MKSPMLAEPIKRLDTSPISDGACAIILATEEKAEEGRQETGLDQGRGALH